MRKRLSVAGAALLTVLAAVFVFVQPAHAAAGFSVANGRLYDANGTEFVMRGVNHAHAWYPQQTSSFANVKALGANTVRVVLATGDRWAENSAADLSNVISLCKANRLICVLEVHDTTGYGEQSGAITLDRAVDYWLSIADALNGQEKYVIVNIGNEPYGNQGYATWATDSANAIKRLRAGGLAHTIKATAREASVYSGSTPTPTTPTPTTPPPTTPPSGGCTASYTIVNQWQGGFQGEVTVTAGSAAITGWTTKWTFTGGQAVSQSWNTALSSSGAAYTARNVDYNGRLGAGASTSFGFIASWNGTNPAPAVTCTAS
ncbi:cellulose binding domain-containing protein [Micromonospora sp. CPCC 206171]|uniref:cellulose binding domain-containing protein n=1 Tax=Micromonospora sp. CPCC 206171 TaxID=3122405 RepID=UPI002FF306C9